MIVVYLANGQTVELAGAVSVEGVPFPGATAADALSCLDGAGKLIGCFRVVEVAGYAVRPDGQGALAPLEAVEVASLPTLAVAPERGA